MTEYGLQVGNPDIRSVGAVTFGPSDLMFVADNEAATIWALDLTDPAPDALDDETFDLDGLSTKLAAFLGCSRDDVKISDMAVHPRTRNVYLTVTRGRGDSAIPLIIRVDRTDGSLEEVSLENVPFAAATISDAPDPEDTRQQVELPEDLEGETLEVNGRTLHILRRPNRTATVTDLAYVDGELLVAGLSNEEFASTLRRLPFPFTGDMEGSSLEIFHVSHGQWETAAPIRTFVPYADGTSILASYTCTPVVHFPLADLEAAAKATGRTVADLGPMNQPLDMLAVTQGDDEYVLVSNTDHGLIKLAARDIDTQEPLTEPQEPVGIPREVEPVQGVSRMANFGRDHVLVLQRTEDGERHLRSLKTASL
jgi:hypothetical protein